MIAGKNKTYNRRDSQMVTHSSTSRPVQCLCMAERTGCPVFTDLWSYVLKHNHLSFITLVNIKAFLLHTAIEKLEVFAEFGTRESSTIKTTIVNPTNHGIRIIRCNNSFNTGPWHSRNMSDPVRTLALVARHHRNPPRVLPQVLRVYKLSQHSRKA